MSEEKVEKTFYKKIGALKNKEPIEIYLRSTDLSYHEEVDKYLLRNYEQKQELRYAVGRILILHSNKFLYRNALKRILLLRTNKELSVLIGGYPRMLTPSQSSRGSRKFPEAQNKLINLKLVEQVFPETDFFKYVDRKTFNVNYQKIQKILRAPDDINMLEIKLYWSQKRNSWRFSQKTSAEID